jgi:hypothetical protein
MASGDAGGAREREKAAAIGPTGEQVTIDKVAADQQH